MARPLPKLTQTISSIATGAILNIQDIIITLNNTKAVILDVEVWVSLLKIC